MVSTVTEIRYNNLRQLRDKADSLISFATQAGLSQAQASQLTTASPRGGGNYKTLGEHLARRIEENLGLARGWLDNNHSEIEVPAIQGPAEDKQAPDKPVRAVPRPSEQSLSLTGLSPLQVAMLTTAAQLCRNKKLTDKQCLTLLSTWQEFVE